MKNEKMAVRVAQEALDQLNRGKIKCENAGYLHINKYLSQDGNSPFNQVFGQGSVDCNACALGALFVGYAMIKDDFRFKDTPGHITQYLVSKPLIAEEIFTRRECIFIEHLFENNDIERSRYTENGRDPLFTDKQLESFLDYKRKLPKNRPDRLRAILEDIISNNGYVVFNKTQNFENFTGSFVRASEDLLTV